MQEPGTTYSSRPVVTPNSTLDSRVRSRSTGTINRAANDSIRDNTSINRGTSRITSGNRKAVYVYPDGITEYRGNKVVRNTRGQSSAISSSADTPEKETKRVSKTKTRDQVFRNLTTQENGQRQSTVRSAKDTAGKESTRVRKTEVRDQVFRNLVPQQDVAREDAARSKTRLDDLETTGVRSEEGSERPQERANLVRSPADRMKTEDQDGVPGRESAKSLRPELGALEPQSGRSGEVKQPQLDRSLDLTPMPSGNINDDVTSEPQSETASGVTITGNNNIFVNGDLTLQQRYPYVSRRYYSPWLHVSSCWNDYDYGWYRPSWGWSSYSYSSSWGFSICLGDFSFSSCYSRWRPRGRVVYYSYGPHYGVSYVYPRYHRKYVFVSYGGWWPVHYGYKRYYWYGCHPYQWYGTYPDEYTVVEKHITNNYYYGGSSSSSSYVPQPSYSYDEYGNIVPDYDAFDKVREKLKKEKEPASVFDEDIPTPADEYFEEAVQSFGAGDYDEATLKFREAVRLAPEDVVLPFAYCQALFAAGDYAHATGVLRQALMKLPEEGQTVFFPRGLYENAGTLQEQINVLARATETEPFSEDYQLLLGYQLLGIGQLDQAQPVLEVTSQNPANTEAAGKLLAILAQIREDN